MVAKLVTRAWNNPWLLLSLCILFWGGNVVAARLATGEVPPVMLGGMRWVVASAVLLPLFGAKAVASRKTIAQHWRFIFLSSLAGYTLYSAFFYGAGNLTTGVNISMLCSVVPVLTIVFAWIFLRMTAGPAILFALLLTMSGALIVATRGDIAVLRDFAFNRGDIFIVTASIMHAAYTVSLRNRPAMPPLVFFTVMCAVAAVTSAFFVAGEIALGRSFAPSWKGVAIIIYAGIFPTLLAQLFYMRGVELIGPQRTGLFYNFVPVTGALMAVALLGEPFAIYHAAGFVLVLAGIVLAERWRARQA